MQTRFVNADLLIWQNKTQRMRLFSIFSFSTDEVILHLFDVVTSLFVHNFLMPIILTLTGLISCQFWFVVFWSHNINWVQDNLSTRIILNSIQLFEPCSENEPEERDPGEQSIKVCTVLSFWWIRFTYDRV